MLDLSRIVLMWGPRPQHSQNQGAACFTLYYFLTKGVGIVSSLKVVSKNCSELRLYCLETSVL